MCPRVKLRRPRVIYVCVTATADAILPAYASIAHCSNNRSLHGGRSTLVSGEGAQAPQIVARPANLAVLLTHCGQSILRKISKFDGTRCQILRLKCAKFDFRWGSAPNPAGGAYLIDLLTAFKGA